MVAAFLYVATETVGIGSLAVRLAATALAVVVITPHLRRWFHTSTGVAAVGLWAALSMANLWSPLRSVRSALELTTMFLSIALVVQVARLIGDGQFRRFLTALAATILAVAIAARAVSSLAAGTFATDELRVETSAAGMWKGFVILSPCPVRWLPARVAFIGFKVLLLYLMLSVDRPKISVLISGALALIVGGTAVLLHRSARTRNVMLMCLTILPVAVVPAIMVGNWLVKEYVRRSDFSGRTPLWRAAIEEVERTRSIFGVGFKNSLTSSEAIAAMSDRFGGDFGRELGGNAVHNVYLELVVEFGLMGVVLVGAILGVTVVGLLHIRSVRLQSSLVIDLLFVLGLCISEPVLEPNTTIFVLICLTVVRVRWHAAPGLVPALPGTRERLRKDVELLGAGGAR